MNKLVLGGKKSQERTLEQKPKVKPHSPTKLRKKEGLKIMAKRHTEEKKLNQARRHRE